MSDEKKSIKRYQLTIRLYEDKEQGELVTRTVNGYDPDDAIGQSPKIIAALIKERHNFNLQSKVTKCRCLGDIDLLPA